ncbi:beta-glucosidase [Ardenticatena maritima]|nr:beta-glucosidase [Ardenticatena maritima]
MGWGINPPGIKREIMNVVERYDNPKIIITENGCAMPDEPDENGFVADWNRIFFLKAHLQQVHEAIQDSANVQGYFVWSILDNFEWERGYSRRFGLVRVEYETLRRIPKQSAYWYRDVIRENALTI